MMYTCMFDRMHSQERDFGGRQVCHSARPGARDMAGLGSAVLLVGVKHRSTSRRSLRAATRRAQPLRARCKHVIPH